MPNGIPCGLQGYSSLVRVVIKKDDGLNVITINILIYMLIVTTF
jgi:hypothetical protein